MKIADNRFLRSAVCALVLVSITILPGCSTNSGSNIDEENSIQIAEQYGLAYAPLVIVKEKGLIEETDSSLSVEWIRLNNTAAIREAMLGGTLDIGFMAIPPYIIGVDNEMNWQAFIGLAKANLALITSRDDVTSIKDITETDRIALPQPGSVQHILLAMAAERELGDSTIFDNQLITMKHPDGMQALNANSEITMHFTSPPYIGLELAEGNHLVLTGQEAFGGEFTFIIGVATGEFLSQSSDKVAVINEAIEKAITYIYQNKEDTIDILAPYYGLEEEQIREYLYSEDLSFGTDIEGMKRFSDFMMETGYTDSSYTKQELVWR